MKSHLRIEKTASSALVFTAFGLLAVSISPCLAAPDVNAATIAETVESSNQGFSASTDLATAGHTTESTSTAIPVEETPEVSISADLSLITQEAEATPAAIPTVAAKIAPLRAKAESQPTTSDSADLSLTNTPIVAASNGQSLETASASVEKTQTDVRSLAIPSVTTKTDSVQAQALPSEDVSDQTLPLADPLEMEPEAAEADPMGQVTNISQLRDVQPTDWAYEALRSLVERYGCIAGYPDGTFRGNRALSRYEFAAGVNACLQQIEKLIAASTADFTTKEDLATLRRLGDEFGAEIATLRSRVDNLEGRTKFLEDNQFSTTTKLFGQAVFGVQGRSDNDFELSNLQFEDQNTNINVISNVQLSLFTQFSPRSLLLTGLQAGAGNTGPRTFNDQIFLGYEGDTGNDVVLSDLTYRQLIGNNFAFIVGPEGVNPVNVFRGANRVESAGQGPLSRFAQRNPIVNTGARGGIGFDWQLGTRLSLQAVYSASSPSDALRGGIFGGNDGETAAGAQLVVSPTNTIDIALQYVNSYSPFGRLNTGVGDDIVDFGIFSGSGRSPINTNAFGATLEWRISPRVTLGGWGGYTTSDVKVGSGTVETVNWMAYLNFPDLFGQGNLAGIYVGQPPKITSSDLPTGRNYPDIISKGGIGEDGGQPSSTTHVEAFYRLRVTDNITITPGVIVLFNPLHNDDNDTITIGSIRTTFTF